MLESLTTSKASDLHSSVDSVKSLGVQRKLTQNSKMGYQQLALQSNKNLKNSLLENAPEASFLMHQDPQLEFLDDGGNVIDSVDVDSSEDIVEAKDFYVTEVTRSEDRTTVTELQYYEDLKNGYEAFETEFKDLYGSLVNEGLDDGQDDFRVRTFYVCIHTLLHQYSNLSFGSLVDKMTGNSEASNNFKFLASSLTESSFDDIRDSMNELASLRLDTENNRLDRPEFQDLLRRRLSRRLSQGEFETLSSWLDSVSQDPERVSLESCGPLPAGKTVQDVENQLLSVFEFEPDFLSPDGRQEIIDHLETRVQDPDRLEELIQEINLIGSDQDPILEFVQGAEDFLSSLGLILSVEDFVDSIESLLEILDSEDADQARPLLKKWLDDRIHPQHEGAMFFEWFTKNMTPSLRSDVELKLSQVLHLLNVDFDSGSSLISQFVSEVETLLGSDGSTLYNALVDSAVRTSSQSGIRGDCLNVLTTEQTFPNTQITSKDYTEFEALSLEATNGFIPSEELETIRLIVKKLFDKFDPDNGEQLQVFKQLCHALFDGRMMSFSEVKTAERDLDARCELSSNPSRCRNLIEWLRFRQFNSTVESELTTVVGWFSSNSYPSAGTRISDQLTKCLNNYDYTLWKCCFVGELLYHVLDFNTPDDFHLSTSHLDDFRDFGFDQSQRSSAKNFVDSYISGLSISYDPVKPDLQEIADSLYNNKRPVGETTNLRNQLDTLLPSYSSELDSIWNQKTSLESTVTSSSLHPDQKSSAIDAIISGPNQYLGSITSLSNNVKVSSLNSVPRLRYDPSILNSGTVASVYSDLSDPGTVQHKYFYTGDPKHSWFGGDTLLSDIRKLRSPESTFFKEGNKVIREINKTRGEIADIRGSILSNIRNITDEVSFKDLRSKILKEVGSFTAKAAEILCALDFVHDVLNEVNGVIDEAVDLLEEGARGLKGIVDDIDRTIQDTQKEISRSLDTLSQLGRLKINPQINCKCISVSVNLELDLNTSFIDDVNDWISSQNLEIPNPLDSLPGAATALGEYLKIDPKLGCPDNILKTLGIDVGSFSFQKVLTAGFPSLGGVAAEIEAEVQNAVPTSTKTLSHRIDKYLEGQDQRMRLPPVKEKTSPAPSLGDEADATGTIQSDVSLPEKPKPPTTPGEIDWYAPREGETLEAWENRAGVKLVYLNPSMSPPYDSEVGWYIVTPSPNEILSSYKMFSDGSNNTVYAIPFDWDTFSYQTDTLKKKFGGSGNISF